MMTEQIVIAIATLAGLIVGGAISIITIWVVSRSYR